MKLHPLRTARAILSRPLNETRRSCEYSGYCGSYGCASGAKGSAREALLNVALSTGKCRIIANAKVNRLLSNTRGEVIAAEYVDANAQTNSVRAKIFVVACQAIETSRLLLYSTGPEHEHGIGNQHNQVGKNMLFSAGGSGYSDFLYADLPEEQRTAYQQRGPFINRGLQDWYEINDKQLGRIKGGTVDFLLRHPNPINRASGIKRDDDDKLVWGSALKQKLFSEFTSALSLRYEIFCDWLPTDDCFVTLDANAKDKWQTPVAKLRVGYHDHDLKVGEYIVQQTKNILTQMGAVNVRGSASGSPPSNLQAGGCRFGKDPRTSVLDPECRVHTASNLYITDGSWMPTGGSVPYTWTIYANAFRVADIIKRHI
jgi:choline dehydrogenase-like flavoprotein